MSKDRNPEELAQTLDDLFRYSELPSATEIDDPLVEVALELAQDEPPPLSADMRARMLDKVLQAQQSTPPASKGESKRLLSFPTQTVLRWVAVFAVFVILLNNVAVPAMADSLPGDLLYPTKLTIESIELGLATSDINRAEIYILQAQRRLDEADRLLASNVVNEQLIVNAIDKLTSASQLNPSTQDEVTSSLEKVDLLIQRVGETQPNVASTLSQKLIEIAPTSEPTTEPIIDSVQIVESTETPTVTPSPTLTKTATASPTPTATMTYTPTPTATNTLEPSPTHTAEPTLTPSYETYVGVVSATSQVNIRELPTVESEIIQQVPPGTIVTIIGESIDGQWLNIDVEDDVQGWIASSLIVEGTIPLFTLATDEEIDPLSTDTATDPLQSTTTTNTTTDSSSSNQGNDGINKFGCDGQGNSCNVGNQGNNGNNGSNGNNGNNSNSGNNGNKKK